MQGDGVGNGVKKTLGEPNGTAVWNGPCVHRRPRGTNPVSRRVVLMRANVIRLLNRVPEHDFQTLSEIRAPQNEIQTNAF